jgi:hypothetical protein
VKEILQKDGLLIISVFQLIDRSDLSVLLEEEGINVILPPESRMGDG